ncbi:PAS domain S-box-containing protein [Larkinella arboricola]|uniref:histidine kinase n=1 Tax=Larkinella arboricola TaxID=643671 RepID=A0A327X6P2_LARAB|nr:PAS domain-containing sensor histidine kinase [Larkinella arboricola]RAK02339.1 PAS domain S-box-containing protein [Larkinella arboricola]
MITNLFPAVFANATIGIILSDSHGRMISVSQFAQKLFGYTEAEMVGQTIEMLVPETLINLHKNLRKSFNDHPEVRPMGHGRGDLYAKRKDGSLFPAEISLSYFHQDQVLYIVAYIIDKTYKVEAERALIEQKNRIEQLNAELEQKVADRTNALMVTLHQLELSKDELSKALATERELGELKSRFVSMASHEFRTPLSAILTSADLLNKYTTTEQQEKRNRHIQRIKASVNHLNDILEEFLSVGKLEEGKIEASYSLFDLSDLVTSIVADIQGMLKPGQTIQLEQDCPGKVWLDKSLIRKIVVNLLSNAIKYSDENKPIRLTTWCRDEGVRISIQDQGIGMSEDDQKHLFERFYRAKNATAIQGTGLGLHIVAQYLALLNGTIDFRSQLNQGTTVTISFRYENNPAH